MFRNHSRNALQCTKLTLMTDDTDNIVPRILQAIQEEQTSVGRKLGTLAEAIVSLRREVQINNVELQSLTLGIHGLKTDIHTLAIAVDSHADRLASMDEQLTQFEARLGRIEQRLDRPH